MKWERHILEGIEACRPGSDDLSSPELAEVARQVVQDNKLAIHLRGVIRFDESIQQAFDDVPLPDGLEKRLLASLDEKPDVVKTLQAPALRTSLRRRWIAATLATAACLAVVAGVVAIRLGGEPWSIAQVRHEVVRWSAMLDDTAWQNTTPPKQLAFPMEARVRPWRWRQLHRPSEGVGNVVVYDLSPPQSVPGALRGSLFVFRAEVANLSATPPIRPAITQGRLVAAWRSGDCICVLVLDNAEPGALRSYYHAWFTGSVRSA